ncbi:hypothetical protein WR25_26950 [Diploscapter pachys]|uniref:Uncharacterized protein n=1 Tax=Diploscapter pachys TaxID=2018661 RepID=A0A2A2LNI1_9BILA|nr:hypothetical protein WR25_26950 [Diploscapter pachys]
MAYKLGEEINSSFRPEDKVMMQQIFSIMLNRTLPYEAKQKSIFDLAKQLNPGIVDMDKLESNIKHWYYLLEFFDRKIYPKARPRVRKFYDDFKQFIKSFFSIVSKSEEEQGLLIESLFEGMNENEWKEFSHSLDILIKMIIKLILFLCYAIAFVLVKPGASSEYKATVSKFKSETIFNTNDLKRRYDDEGLARLQKVFRIMLGQNSTTKEKLDQLLTISTEPDVSKEKLDKIESTIKIVEDIMGYIRKEVIPNAKPRIKKFYIDLEDMYMNLYAFLAKSEEEQGKYLDTLMDGMTDEDFVEVHDEVKKFSEKVKEIMKKKGITDFDGIPEIWRIFENLAKHQKFPSYA